MTDINGNEQIDEQGSADDTPEFDQMLSSFAKTESHRRKKGLIYGLVALVIAVGLFLLAFVFRNEVFGPPIDVEAGEEAIIDKTDDPQCRAMIADVHDLSERYFKLEATIDAELLGGDAKQIQKIRDEIARLQQRLDEIEEDSRAATLRFHQSSQELKDWFDYVELELSFVDRLAKERLAHLSSRDQSPTKGLKGDAGAAKKDVGPAENDKQAAGDVGTDAHEGVVVEKGEETTKKKTATKDQKTPKERKRGALIALHDAFQKFRVWHSSSAHPCGAADEGEKPWRPQTKKGAPKAPKTSE
jgi:hypothetical protein